MSGEASIQQTETKGCRICEHIKDDGIRCSQPALTGEVYCRFHIRMRVTVSPEDALYELPVLETERSVQIALQHMMGALLRGKLSERKAAVMMSALKTAASLIRQSNENPPPDPVREKFRSEFRAEMAKRRQRWLERIREQESSN